MTDQAIHNVFDLTPEQAKDEEIKRLKMRIKDWEHFVGGLVANFDGVTDNAADPDRLHPWQWIEEHYHPPESIQELQFED